MLGGVSRFFKIDDYYSKSCVQRMAVLLHCRSYGKVLCWLLCLVPCHSLTIAMSSLAFVTPPHTKLAITSLSARVSRSYILPWSMSLNAGQPSEPSSSIGAWLPIGSAKTLGGETPVQVEVAGEKLVVWRSGETWSVMKDACPHRLAPLSQGRVDLSTGCIECPYHGWQFSGSGACTRIPQLPPQGPRVSAGATSYPVRLTGDAIWAFMPLPPGQVLCPPNSECTTANIFKMRGPRTSISAEERNVRQRIKIHIVARLFWLALKCTGALSISSHQVT